VLLVESSERATALEGTLQLASRYQTLAALHATADHDFRGSLNAIGLHVELLERTVDPSAPRASVAEVQRRCIQAIRQELDRLAESVGSVLDESRPDQTLAAPFRLMSVVESVLSLVRAKAERQRVTMGVDTTDATIEVMGRASQMRQAVLNLVNNALEAMPQGGELSLTLTTDGAFAVLTVSDTGRGLPGDLRGRIWDLSYSTKSQGLGIGLHVVKSVAHAHGGTVTLDQTGAGARFTLRLPFAR
jgi:signal transduction histidine kinase